jgi:vacuolar protein sorting-associated protein 35
MRLLRRISAREQAVAAHAEKQAAGGGGDGGDGEDGEGGEGGGEDGGAEEAPRPPKTSSRKVFKTLHETITALAGVDELQETAMRMFLQCVVAASACGPAKELIAYEFMVQAFTLYEDIADSKAQLRAIRLIAGTMDQCAVFGRSNNDTLTTKAAQYSAKLLKKADQARMVFNCSNLFWSSRRAARSEAMRGDGDDEEEGAPAVGKNGKRALECLQRALKIADVCMADQSQLFVAILNRYLYFFELGLGKITPQHLSGLIALINELMAQPEGDASSARKAVEAFYQNTIRHVKLKQQAADSAERYQQIDV